MKNLLWLASYPKSGNTWVRALLTAYLTDAVGPFDLKSMDPFTASESLVRAYLARSGKTREELDEATIDSLRREIQEALTARKERPFWLKTHNGNFLRKGQRLVCPEFTQAAVYIVRNPLDVADSLADSTGRTTDQAIALLNDNRHALGGPKALHVKQFLGTWSQHVGSWIQEKEFPVLVLRYEDMHADSASAFRRLLQFLGWPLDEDRLQRAIDRTSFCKLQEIEQERGFAERNPAARSGRFFRQGQFGHWPSVLSRAQAELILSRHGEAMRAVGYAVPNLDEFYGPTLGTTMLHVGLGAGHS
jgi:hypothetical protein